METTSSDQKISAIKADGGIVNQELNGVAKSGSLDGILRIFAYGISFIVSALLVRISGAAALGSVAVTLSAMNMLQILPGMGLSMGILKIASGFLGKKDHKNAGKVFLYSFAATFSAATVLVLFYFLVLRVYFFDFIVRSVGSIDVFDALIVTFPLFSVNSLFTASFQALQKSYKNTLYDQIVRNIGRLLITFLLSLFISKTFSLVYGTMAGIAISISIQLIVILIELKKIGCFEQSPIKFVKDVSPFSILRYSLPLLVIPLLNSTTRELDIWIVGYNLTVLDTGIYSIVRLLGGLLLIPNLMFAELFGVSISKAISNDDHESVKSLVRVSAKWVSLLNGLVFIIIVSLGRDILLIFGKEFKPGISALMLYGAGMFFIGFFGATGPLLLMFNKKSLLNANAILMVVLNIVLGLWLTPEMGINGAALSTGLTFTIGSFLSLFQVIFIIKIKPGSFIEFARRLLIIIACTLFIFLLSNFLAEINYIFRLLICLPIAIGIYGCLVFITEHWSQFEIGFLMNLKTKLLSR
jgi:O-antigen/teichoic acid export membrane protein